MKSEIVNRHACQGKVSGPAVVFTLFFGSFLLFGIAFFVAYRQKVASQTAIANLNARELYDSTSNVESVNKWLSVLPFEWVKITAVEGQGHVIFIPCYSTNPELTLHAKPDSLPHLHCENCDSLEDYGIQSLARMRADSSLEIRLLPEEGQLRIIPVTDSLLQKYPQAPFRDHQMVWIRYGESGKLDTLLFAPKSQVDEFETLRAEDENPEGCGSEPAD